MRFIQKKKKDKNTCFFYIEILYLVNPKDGSIKPIKRRKTNVLRIMEWFLLDRVQWLSHSSDLITITGNNAAKVHNNNVGMNSDKIGLCKIQFIYNLIHA